MAVHLQCPACGVSSPAPDSLSGRSVRCKKCGTPFVARPTFDGGRADTRPAGAAADPFPTLPAEFGRYRVLRLLGRGGMGAVYLAKDSQLGREVAVKIPFFDPKEASRRAERFVREAQAAAALHHPNICTVFDAGRINGTPFLTMAFVRGTPLDRAIDPDAPMAQERAAGIARRVARGLAHAHAQGVVHRDLKPANVMLAEDGEPVVMDFGLAKRGAGEDASEAKLTRDGGVLGTPSYMSPEQVRGDADVGPASDVYALGVLLFEMLTGRTPYSGNVGAVMGQILAAPVPPLADARPDADPRLDAICRRAMAKSADARFPSMAAFAQALDDYLTAAATPTMSVELVEPVAGPAAVASAVVRPTPTPTVPPPAPFADLTDWDEDEDEDEAEVAPRRTATRRKPATAAAGWGGRRIGLIVGVVAAALVPLVALGAFLMRVETANGTLVVEVADEEVEAKVKNGKLVLSGPDGKVRYTLSAGERDKKLEAGAYTVRVEGADGLTLDTPEFVLKKGETVTVRVTAEKTAVAKKDDPWQGGLKADPRMPTAVEYDVIASGRWAPAIPSVEEFNRVRDAKSHTGNLAKYEDGVLEFNAGQLFFPTLEAKDAIVRAQVKKPGQGKNARLVLRNSMGSHVVAWFDGGGTFGIGVVAGGEPWKVLSSVNLPESYDDFFEMAFAAVGDKLLVYANGRKVLEARHESLSNTRGQVGVGGTGHGWIRDIEVQLLDTPQSPLKTNGFVPLFNGKDLTGWKAQEGSRLTAWGVTAGVLHCGGEKGGWLLTEKEYASYELRLEYKLSARANSGVAVRSTPGALPAKELEAEVQLLDDEWYLANLKGLRKDQQNAALYEVVPPSHPAAKPVGEWNSLRVVVNGRALVVELNGVKVVEADLDASAAKHANIPGLRRASGHIGLAGSESRVEFRKVEIKELPAGPKGATDFTPLFNGKDLTGWTGVAGLWAVRDGLLVGSSQPNALGYNTCLCADREYADFELRCQLKLVGGAKANSGLQIRSKLIDATKWVVEGPQVDAGGEWWGSLYGERAGGMMQAADPAVVAKAVKPGEFNELSVRCVGTRVTIRLNGVTTVDREFPGLPARGLVGLQLHGAAAMAAEFRSVEIKDLSADAKKAAKPDPFPEKSVWVGTGTTRQVLTVTERAGESFRARFEVGAGIVRDVSGTVKDGKVTWLAKDVKAVTGGPGGDNTGTFATDKDGDRLDFTWTAPGTAGGSFVLRRQKGQ